MVNFIVICVSLFRYVLISKTSTSSKAFDVGEVELLVDLQPRKIERGVLDLLILSCCTHRARYGFSDRGQLLVQRRQLVGLRLLQRRLLVGAIVPALRHRQQIRVRRNQERPFDKFCAQHASSLYPEIPGTTSRARARRSPPRGWRWTSGGPTSSPPSGSTSSTSPRTRSSPS